MLREDHFAFLRRILKDRSGLALNTDKHYLITARLKPIIEAHGFADVGELVAAMRDVRGARITEEVVDAMTTNESLFFRDTQPFDALIKHMLPTLMRARGGRPIRIWCAAASTGQEPYSIAIVLEENAAKLAGQRVEILASDISQAALRRARFGEYTEFEVGRGVPPHLLGRYFQKVQRNHWTIAPRIKSRVTFECRNLLEPFARLGTFDIVFCRNVLIYFDRPTKTGVLERISGVLAPDGYLVLGGAETTLGLTARFSRHRTWRNVYVRAASDISTMDRLPA